MFASQYPPPLNPPRTTGQHHHKETIWRILLDIISLIILIAIAVIINFVAKPFTRGFFCSDTSIQYPKQDNTIPTSAAVILSIGLPIIWNFVGELRPNFLAVCQPTYNCSAVTSLSQFHSYLQYESNYTCQNTDDSAVRDARKAFFSGHASAIFYGFVWLIMYIHVSWSWRHLGIVGHLFQVGIAILAFYIAYTRISDFQHNWYDVLVGIIVGSFIAFFTFKFILDWRRYTPQFLPYIVSSSPRTSPVFQPGHGDFSFSNSYNIDFIKKITTIFFVMNNSNSVRRFSPSKQQQQHLNDSTTAMRWIQKPLVAVRSLQSTTQEISLLKLIFDGFSILLVFSPWLIFKYLVKPIRRSFLCSDLNLYHPKPIKTAVPTWLLVIYAVVIPVIIILCSEGVRWYYLVRKRAAPMIYKIQIRSTIYNISQWTGNLYISLVVFAFAHGVNSFLTNVGKVSVGRLRPHFIPSCFNKFSYTDFCNDPNQWISNYTCIGESSTVLKEKDGAYDIRQSFPSGHASTAFCGLMFLALYIHKIWRYRNIGLFPYVLEMGCFALAAYISITRVTDHRHHPTDVLSGAILGSVIAIIAFHYMIKSFKQSILSQVGDGQRNKAVENDNML
ncbi:unnamed protein product [Rotaria socialis]